MTYPEQESREAHSTPSDKNQLVLPLDLGITRQVVWYHGELITQRRWLRTKKVVRLVVEQSTGLPAKTFIDAGSIAELKDPALRHALALADTTNAVGWTHTSPTGASAHDVMVIATNDGIDSRLVAAQYTGVGEGSNDSFMQNLHSAAPHQNTGQASNTGC